MNVILTIAGSDSSAGAGIQQDLKTITSLGHYAATVITAVTAQNTVGVRSVNPVPADVVRAQLEAVLDDMPVRAIKIGMVPTLECAEVIVDCLEKVKVPIVYDPVMVSTSGKSLMTDDCVDFVIEKLFPLCTLVTPNLPESERIAGRYSSAYLVKGGHADGDEMTDVLHDADANSYSFSSKKIDSSNLHGTGCTLSSAIATFLSTGLSLKDSVASAKEVINRGIEGGKCLTLGHGNGPLWLF